VSGNPAIAVSDLTVRYGALTAVDRLSFTIERGTVTAMLGPNGAGKTTTIETLEGYRRPTSGSTRVLGLDPLRDHRQLVARVGVMPQENGVYTGIRPHEVLALFASYYPDPLDPDELLERVGLADRRRTTWRRLSGGEKQRLSLALALVGRPELVFLDEPTSGIDPAGRTVVREVIGSLRDAGVTVLLTTHDLAETERLADHVVIIDHGRLLAAGPPAELRAGGDRADICFAAPPGIDTAELAAALGVPVSETSAGEYVVATPPTPAAVAALTTWLAARDIAIGDLRAGRQTLEDVFLRLTDDGASNDEDPA
jgi:ABC-2 type transport system ATP-binding protein